MSMPVPSPESASNAPSGFQCAPPATPVQAPAGEREKVLRLAAHAGDLLLRCGAETYRAEETISRICAAYGYRSEPFALPTGIFASISGDGPPLSIVRRIKSRSFNLGCVAQVNAFARDVVLAPPNLDEGLARLAAIEKTGAYPKRHVFLSYSLTAAIFTLLYMGTPTDAAGALIIGMLLAVLRQTFSRLSPFPFFENFTGGLVAGFFTLLGTRFVPGMNVYVVVTGALINLMPGTALVNGVRDMLNGDSVSGIARLGEAIVSVGIMAAGAAIGMGMLSAVWPAP